MLQVDMPLFQDDTVGQNRADHLETCCEAAGLHNAQLNLSRLTPALCCDVVGRQGGQFLVTGCMNSNLTALPLIRVS
jgi:hypothetical protein